MTDLIIVWLSAAFTLLLLLLPRWMWILRHQRRPASTWVIVFIFAIGLTLLWPLLALFFLVTGIQTFNRLATTAMQKWGEVRRAR